MKTLNALVAASLSAGLLAACGGGLSPASPPSVSGQLPHTENRTGSLESSSSCITKQCIYVANSNGGSGQGSITVYALDANGNAAPIATIAGSNTGLVQPQAVAVDKNHRIYVSNYSSSPTVYASITVYEAGASGNIAPIQTIAGSNTGLSQPYGIDVNIKNHIFVSENGDIARVAVFPTDIDGNVAPVRTFGVRSGATHPRQVFWGVAVDKAERTYVASPACRCGAGRDEVLVYARNAEHYEKPVQMIRGAATTLQFPKGIAVDRDSNIYVANADGAGVGSVVVYAAGANGNARPIQNVVGHDTDLSGPNGLALDAKRQIYVSDIAPAIKVFAARANGDVAPIRLIFGSATGLSGVTGVAVR